MQMEKWFISGATIVDGTGGQAWKGDILLDEGRIAAVGQLGESIGTDVRIVDGKDMVVCPGFIDMHSHQGLVKNYANGANSKVMQGITTEVAEAPGRDKVNSAEDPVDWLEHLAADATPVNRAALYSYRSLRQAMMDERGEMTAADQTKMTGFVETLMKEGAFGVAVDFSDPTCSMAARQELVSLAGAVQDTDGLLVLHLRNKREQVKKSLREVLSIAKETRVKTHVSGLQVRGRENWGSSGKVLSLFDQALQEGVSVSFDQHPYTSDSGKLLSLLPPIVRRGGKKRILEQLTNDNVRMQIAQQMADVCFGWDNVATGAGWERIMVVGLAEPENKAWEGQNLQFIADEAGRTPQEMVFELLKTEKLAPDMVHFSVSEWDVGNIAQHPAGMLGTDNNLIGRPHPRTYESAVRVLTKYVREKKQLSLETAIARMTSTPAKRLGLSDRGVIRQGKRADLLLFDLNRLQEHSTYMDPWKKPEGIRYVWVNGVPVVASGALTGELPGQLLLS